MALNEREWKQLVHAVGMMDGMNLNGTMYSPRISMLKLLATYSEPGLTITVEEDRKTGTISWNFVKENQDASQVRRSDL